MGQGLEIDPIKREEKRWKQKSGLRLANGEHVQILFARYSCREKTMEI